MKPSRRITPEEVQAKEFGTARVRVGYRMHEVDEFLDQITDTLSGLIAENERLRSERSRGASSGRAVPVPPSDGREREAVEAFLHREKAFLQSLGSLVQGHAEELKEMVRASRGAAAAAVSPVVATDAPVERPLEPPHAGEPEGGADEPEGGDDEAPATAGAIGAAPSDEGASRDPSPHDDEEDVAAILGGDDRDTGAIETVEAEEPIRLDEPQPARSRRADEGSEGSLRELFWGEE